MRALCLLFPVYKVSSIGIAVSIIEEITTLLYHSEIVWRMERARESMVWESVSMMMWAVLS